MQTQPQQRVISSFVQALSDQALIFQSRQPTRPDGRWPSENVRGNVWAQDGYWMAGLVPAVLDAWLSEAKGRVVIASSPTHEFMEITLNQLSTRAPCFEHGFVVRAVRSVSEALCQSPRFAGNWEFEFRGRTYTFRRERVFACFDSVPIIG